MSIVLDDKLIVDSRMCLSAEGKAIEIQRGATNLSVNLTNSQQASNSTIVWTPQLPKGRIVVDPLMLVQIPIQVTVTANGLTGQNVDTYISNNFALRQYPVNSVLNNISLTLNNQTISSQPYQWINELSRFESIDYQNSALRQSLWPIMPDASPQYSDLAGSGKSPLLSYESGTDIYANPRGVFNSSFQLVSSDNNTYVFNTTLIEPLMVPILDYDPSKKRVGLPHLNSMQLQLTFLSNLSRMFSLDADTCPLISGVTVNIQGPAVLRQQWLTVPVNLPIPSVNIRSFNSLTCIPSQVASFNAGEQRIITSQSLTFNQIPKKIWVYVREAQIDSVNAYQNTDTCFSIQKAVVTFNNKTGLLSNMSSADLYLTQEAEKGSVISYTAAQNYVGDVLCIDPVESFGLADDETSSIAGNFQFLIELTATNLKNSTVLPAIYIVYANDTIASLNENADMTLQQNFVKREYVLQASSLTPYPAKFMTGDMYGGAFWDSVKSGLSKAWDFIKNNQLISKAAKLASNVPMLAPVASTVGNVAQAVGLGYGGKKMTRRQMLKQQQYLAY